MTTNEEAALYVSLGELIDKHGPEVLPSRTTVEVLLTCAASIHLAATAAPLSEEILNEMVRRVLSDWSHNLKQEG